MKVCISATMIALKICLCPCHYDSTEDLSLSLPMKVAVKVCVSAAMIIGRYFVVSIVGFWLYTLVFCFYCLHCCLFVLYPLFVCFLVVFLFLFLFCCIHCLFFFAAFIVRVCSYLLQTHCSIFLLSFACLI